MAKVKPIIPTIQLIRRLHLMAESGGMLTPDRIEAVRQAADRLDEYLAEKEVRLFNVFNGLVKDGDRNEKH